MSNIVHVVLIEWNKEMSAATLDKLRETARAMQAQIRGIMKIDEGRSVSPEGLEGGFSYGLVIIFEDAAARDGYLPHPAHQRLVDQIVANSRRVAVFDIVAT
jgi:Stress responsive A/B Barrel Domain